MTCANRDRPAIPCSNFCKAPTRQGHGWRNGIPLLWKRKPRRMGEQDEDGLFASRSGPVPHHGPARLRGVPQERRFVGTLAPVYGMRPRGLLRLLEKQARDQTF